MISIRYFLDTRKKTKDGLYQLSVVLQHNNRTATFPSGIRLHEGEFDNKAQRVPDKVKMCRQLNETLNLKMSSLRIELGKLSAIGWTDGKSVQQIRNRLTDSDSHATPYLYMYIQKHIDGIEKQRTAEIFRRMYRKMELCFDNFKSIRLNEFDIQMLSEFERKMMGSCNVTTRGIYLSKLKTVINAAVRERLIDRDSNPFSGFRIKKGNIRHLVLPVGIMRKIRDYVAPKPKMQVYTDFFMLSFYLCGINPIDLLMMPKLIDGKLRYNRHKTGIYTEIDIPEEAMDIIYKYSGKDLMLRFCEGKGEEYVDYFCNNCIARLKEIKDSDGNLIYPDISLYYARHTWSTIAHDIDIPEGVIDMALAHKSPYTMSEHYIRRNMKKVGEAARKVIDYLNEDKKRAG